MLSRAPALLLFAGLLAGCYDSSPMAPEADFPAPEPSFALVSGSATYLDLIASLTGPDVVDAGVDFNLTAQGTIEGAFFAFHSYRILENTTWSYDDNHLVQATGGTVLEESGVTFGASLDRVLTLNRPDGTYTFTLVFGQRDMAHGYYDVAVDLVVTVGTPTPPAPSLCGAAWLPPLKAVAKAGRTVPLKFSIASCSDGTFQLDEGVTAYVVGPDEEEVAAWSYADSPADGIAFDDGQYHVNWSTPSQLTGDHTIRVVFTSGDELTRTITLR